jgi:AbrB family looped-hinge helix DNA binding protein
MESRLSSKGQVTIPRKVREALGLRAGDAVAYEIRGRSAVIRKLEGFDAAFHRALERTLDEWRTPEDEEAFRDL